MSLPRRCAALLLIVASAAGTGLATAPTASAVDPAMMANCVTETVADPTAVVAVPPEVPLVGCLTI